VWKHKQLSLCSPQPVTGKWESEYWIFNSTFRTLQKFQMEAVTCFHIWSTERHDDDDDGCGGDDFMVLWNRTLCTLAHKLEILLIKNAQDRIVEKLLIVLKWKSCRTMWQHLVPHISGASEVIYSTSMISRPSDREILCNTMQRLLQIAKNNSAFLSSIITGNESVGFF